MNAIDAGLGAGRSAMQYLTSDNNLWSGNGISQADSELIYGPDQPETVDWDRALKDVFETFNANQLALQKQNSANSLALWEKQKNWQTEMANTAHQREMADLRNAGLNPILTAVGSPTSGAPTGGSTANPSVPNAEGNIIADIAMGLVVGLGKVLNSASGLLKDGVKFNTKLSLF